MGFSLRIGRILALLFLAALLFSTFDAQAAKMPKRAKLSKDSIAAIPRVNDMQPIHISGGKKVVVVPELPSDSMLLVMHTRDSLLRADSLRVIDSLAHVLTKKQMRQYEDSVKRASGIRHNRYFRDSISISNVCALTAVLPGFGQLYNDQTWKVPVAYGIIGGSLALGIHQNKIYKDYKKQSDALLNQGITDRAQLDPIQGPMIRHNTYRQIFFITTAATWIYFIGDAAINYEGYTNSVKKATTLSTICPGAGQLYNKSYWKVPIVLGAFATLGYVLDFNARNYNRFKLAYSLDTDDDPDTHSEFYGRSGITPDYLRTLKNGYRRDRDFSIILLGLAYLLNLVDAHVDAHLKDYDVSDDLSMKMTLQPYAAPLYAMNGQSKSTFGVALRITF